MPICQNECWPPGAKAADPKGHWSIQILSEQLFNSSGTVRDSDRDRPVCDVTGQGQHLAGVHQTAAAEHLDLGDWEVKDAT